MEKRGMTKKAFLQHLDSCNGVPGMQMNFDKAQMTITCGGATVCSVPSVRVSRDRESASRLAEKHDEAIQQYSRWYKEWEELRDVQEKRKIEQAKRGRTGSTERP